MWNTFYMLQHTECSYASPGSPCMRTILAMRSCHTCKQQRLWGMSMLTCQQGLYRECQCSHAKSYTAILLALFPGFTNQGSSSLWVTDLQLNIQWWYTFSDQLACSCKQSNTCTRAVTYLYFTRTQGMYVTCTCTMTCTSLVYGTHPVG